MYTVPSWVVLRFLMYSVSQNSTCHKALLHLYYLGTAAPLTMHGDIDVSQKYIEDLRSCWDTCVLR